MPKIFCPLCKQTLDKVYLVSEMEAEWDSTEEFYMPVGSADFLDYYKCMKCRTILQDKGKKLPKQLKVKDKTITSGKKKSGS